MIRVRLVGGVADGTEYVVPRLVSLITVPVFAERGVVFDDDTGRGRDPKFSAALYRYLAPAADGAHLFMRALDS